MGVLVADELGDRLLAHAHALGRLDEGLDDDPVGTAGEAVGDELAADQTGQDSHVRLASHVERGVQLFVEREGELLPVEVEPDDRFLHTRGSDDPESDPILKLPAY